MYFLRQELTMAVMYFTRIRLNKKSSHQLQLPKRSQHFEANQEQALPMVVRFLSDQEFKINNRVIFEEELTYILYIICTMMQIIWTCTFRGEHF